MLPGVVVTLFLYTADYAPDDLGINGACRLN